MKIGFIGQGFIGKSYADDMERRGFKTIRYALEEPYLLNKEKIKHCDIVFIAVPTPTTPRGFDYSMVRHALSLVGAGKTVVVKSTLLPGTTRELQKKFPRLYVMHSPEFLVLTRAAEDAARPLRNILGLPTKNKKTLTRAKQVMKILPRAPFELVCTANEAELIKYGGNLFLYTKVLFANIMYEAAKGIGANYDSIRKAMSADPRVGGSHLAVVHNSGHRGAQIGRGAGGACFIKDIEAFARFYKKTAKNPAGERFLRAAINKNIELLRASQKDLDLLEGVYGKRVRRHRVSIA